MKISEVALSLYSRNSSRIQVRLFTFHCFHIMAHFRSACQLAWKTKKKKAREWQSNYNFSEYLQFLFCLYCTLSTSVWRWCLKFLLLTTSDESSTFLGPVVEKNKLENLASAVKWLSLHCWTKLNPWLYTTSRSQYNGVRRRLWQLPQGVQSFKAFERCGLEVAHSSSIHILQIGM